MSRHKLYFAKKGSHLSNTQAQAIGERFEKITKGKGQLTPTAIVADARSEQSPLHPHFEWEDTAAATQWRLQEARTLVQAVVHVYAENDGDPPQQVRAFLHVTSEEDEPHYVSIDVISKDEDLQQQVVDRALKELRNWQTRYKQYSDLQHITTRVGAILDKIAAGG